MTHILKSLLHTSAAFYKFASQDSRPPYAERDAYQAVTDLFDDPELIPVYLDLLTYGPSDPLGQAITAHYRFRGVYSPEMFQPLITFIAREYRNPPFSERVITHYELHAVDIAASLYLPPHLLDSDSGFVFSKVAFKNNANLSIGLAHYRKALFQENPNLPEKVLSRYERAFPTLARTL